jgi:hypothetical protein
MGLWPALACAGLAACAPGGISPGNENGAEPPPADAQRGPVYGPVRRLAGDAAWGMETEVIDVCGSSQADCGPDREVRDNLRDCWLTYTPEGNRSLRSFLGGRAPDNGSYWIEVDGRVALQPGGFGHLNQYRCQIEVVRVHTFIEDPLVPLPDRARP